MILNLLSRTYSADDLLVANILPDPAELKAEKLRFDLKK
jgi:hypothetical protein